MLIFTTRFSRKKAVLTVIAIGMVMAALIILAGRIKSEEISSLPQMVDNTQRTDYLHSLGWTVNPEPVETLQFLLPETLEEPYLSYNALQIAQGFDLTTCLGKQITRYTYVVTNYPGRPDGVQANLYICEERPVAGDICCPGANGFQEKLLPSTSE